MKIKRYQIQAPALLSSLISLAAPACVGLEPVRNNNTTTLTTNASIYVYQSDADGFHTNTVFVDSGLNVMAFDAQFTEQQATKAVEFLRSKTSSPISHLVITHPNPDKFNGAGVFRAAGARVIASNETAKALPAVHNYKKQFFAETAKMFTEKTYPKLAQVDEKFQKSLQINLGNGVKVSLTEHGVAGVSSNQTTAFVPSLNALVVGDLLHPKTHAWLEGGVASGQANPDLNSWKALLKKLGSTRELKDATVYAGRGPDMLLSEAAKEQINYLNRAQELTQAHVDRTPAAEPFGEASLGELTQSFAEAFPGFQHPYLIQFGIYGLLGQIAAQ